MVVVVGGGGSARSGWVVVVVVVVGGDSIAVLCSDGSCKTSADNCYLRLWEPC